MDTKDMWDKKPRTLKFTGLLLQAAGRLKELTGEESPETLAVKVEEIQELLREAQVIAHSRDTER